jgi:hypothetical protein
MIGSKYFSNEFRGRETIAMVLEQDNEQWNDKDIKVTRIGVREGEYHSWERISTCAVPSCGSKGSHCNTGYVNPQAPFCH